MPISTSEQVTYIALYFFALRNYGRFLNRFYFYHFPYIKLIEYALALILLFLFIHIIRRYALYFVRLILILCLTFAPWLVRLI